MRINHLLITTALVTLVVAGCQPSSKTATSDTKGATQSTEETAAVIESTTPIVLPGAPGQAARTLSAEEAVKIADNSYSPDDVTFMQNMIPHHAQAVEMAALVKARTNYQELVDIAGRIDASQADEIKFMEDWLRDRGEKVPSAKNNYGSSHAGHHEMEGMATPKQMEQLANSEGTEFDKLFLSLMIPHHEGALTMVEDLTGQPGSAYDPVLFDFISDIVQDQTDEIERMSAMLGSLSPDDRAGLKAGYKDAEQAAMNLKLEAALSNPPGFFDPKNPSGLPPVKLKKDDKDNKKPASRSDDGQSLDDTQWSDRSPLLSFSNTDMAFANDILVTGSYHGFNIYKLQDDGMPKLYSSVVCPGGQGDVSIVGDLLIMSVEQTRGRVDCGLQGISEDVSEDRFRGLRIFDISNLAQPVQVGQVQTCRGSHTHSVVTSDETKIIVYNSGLSLIHI